MKNKIGKLFAFAIFSFLVSTLSVHAISYDITNPNSFDAMLDKYNANTQSVYVIGSYVFTTDHTLTTQDMMLSALSIDLSDYEGELIGGTNAYDKMTIFKLNREYDDDDNPTGKWTVDTNFLGKDALKDGKMVEVSYVDYEKAQSDSSLEVNTEASEQMRTDLTTYGYDVVLDNQENIQAVPTTSNPKVIMLSGKVYKVEDIKNWAEEKQTGYYVAFEVVIPAEYQGKAQWWLDENNKLTHDGKNYGVVAISKDAEPQTFEVYVDFDGEGDEYEPTRYVFDYSGIEFAAKASEAKLTYETSDNEVLGVYASALNISSEDFVTIDNYKIKGDIHYNPDVTVLPEQKTNYYVPIVVEIDKEHVNTATVTTQTTRGTSTVTFKDKADNNDKNIMALLMTVAPGDSPKTFSVTVDLDGEGTEYEPKTYVYDYSEANFIPAPEAQISANGIDKNQTKYKEVMNTQFGYAGNPETLHIQVDDHNVTLTGALVNEKYKFNGTDEDVEGYYFQYVIEISGEAKNSTITIPVGPGKTQMFKYEQFDFKNENGMSGIVVLHKLNSESETNKFSVTVDLDGDGKRVETYNFDYTALHLDKNSVVSVTGEENKVPEADKSEYEEYGFTDELYSLTKIKDNVISGTIPFIEKISEDAFVGEDVTGNYMVYTIELAGLNKEGKAQVKLHCTNGSNCINGWKIVDTKANEDFSVLHSVKVNADGSIPDIVAYVDLDGFDNNDVATASLTPENKYLPYEVRLTFDKNIVVQKKSDVEVKTTLTADDEQALADAYGYSENEGTLSVVQVVHQSDSLPVYKYSGKIKTQVLKPESGFNKLEDGFIAFVVAPKTIIPNKTIVTIDKASNDAKPKTITFEDEEPFVFVRRVDNENSEIKLTVDIDGEGTEYLPYSFYINYNDVEVEQVVHQTVPEVMAQAAATGIETAFNFKAPKDQNLSFDYDGTTNTINVTGKVGKNLEVKNMGKDPSGYYVPFSLNFDQVYKDITIKMPGNSNITKYDSFDTSTEIGALVAIYPNKVNTKLEIEVDLDGEKSVYQPYKITLDYSQVKFLSNGASVVKVDESTNPGLKDWMNNHYQITDFKFNDYTVTRTDNTIKVSGKATKQATSDSDGEYWLFYKFVFDQKYDDIEITRPSGSVIKQNTSDWDGGKDGKEITFTKKITADGPKSEIIKIDFDGAANALFEQVDYTIDWSDVTFE